MERAKDFVKKWLTEEEISGRKLNNLRCDFVELRRFYVGVCTLRRFTNYAECDRTRTNVKNDLQKDSLKMTH